MATRALALHQQFGSPPVTEKCLSTWSSVQGVVLVRLDELLRISGVTPARLAQELTAQDVALLVYLENAIVAWACTSSHTDERPSLDYLLQEGQVALGYTGLVSLEVEAVREVLDVAQGRAVLARFAAYPPDLANEARRGRLAELGPYGPSPDDPNAEQSYALTDLVIGAWCQVAVPRGGAELVLRALGQQPPFDPGPRLAEVRVDAGSEDVAACRPSRKARRKPTKEPDLAKLRLAALLEVLADRKADVVSKDGILVFTKFAAAMRKRLPASVAGEERDSGDYGKRARTAPGEKDRRPPTAGFGTNALRSWLSSLQTLGPAKVSVVDAEACAVLALQAWKEAPTGFAGRAECEVAIVSAFDRAGIRNARAVCQEFLADVCNTLK
jgi:hypothetical protein